MGKHWRETFKMLGKGDKKALKSPRAKRKGKALTSDSETLRANRGSGDAFFAPAPSLYDGGVCPN